MNTLRRAAVRRGRIEFAVTRGRRRNSSTPRSREVSELPLAEGSAAAAVRWSGSAPGPGDTSFTGTFATVKAAAFAAIGAGKTVG